MTLENLLWVYINTRQAEFEEMALPAGRDFYNYRGLEAKTTCKR